MTVGVDNTGVCAGIIGEIGCSWPLTEGERKVVGAAASAQRRTGAPLVIHPGLTPLAPMEIIETLVKKGADLSRVVFCHADCTFFDIESRRKVVEAGCYLEFDQFGLESYFYFDYPTVNLPSPNLPNDAQRIDNIAELIAEGYLKHILVSQDICTKIQLTRYGGRGYAYISRCVVPLMRRKGMSEEHIHTIICENPKRMLRFSKAII